MGYLISPLVVWLFNQLMNKVIITLIHNENKIQKSKFNQLQQ